MRGLWVVLSCAAIAGCGGGSDPGATGGSGGTAGTVTIPSGQACGIVAKGDAASGVGTVTWSGQLATCTSGDSANTSVTEEVIDAAGISSTFILAAFIDPSTSKEYTAGFSVFNYGASGTATAPMPLNTDITQADGLVATFSASTLQGQGQGGWASASATMRVTSRTATTTHCTGTGVTCYTLHGTVHAVMTGAASGSGAFSLPAGKGTVTLDVAF